jgi:alginate O-acetyltransferase complex protein AlgI
MKGFDSDWSYLNFKLLLPVGISFYTFQALSYSMDIYRNELKAERHFGKYALFVSFFPQLVAGPIERSTSLLPQLQTRKKFDWLQARDGVLLILWGLIKKMVIADRLAVFVNEVYTEPTLYTGDDLLIATVFFSFQIYLDFSSYSDIAIGSAQVLGINLMTNFRRPYFATSIPDFWRRWHISLSTWFRDYLYFPLGGNRTSYIKWLRNILIVFLVSGLWHGASWNFVIWGAIHGIIQISSIVTKRFRENIKRKLNINDKSFGHKLFQIGLTFSIVTFAWIFFRAETFEDSIYIIKNLFVNTGDIILLGQNSAIKDISLIDLKFGVLLIIILLIIQAIQSRLRIRDFIYKQSLFFRWSVYSMMILVIVIFGVYGDGTVQEFIYFQF